MVLIMRFYIKIRLRVRLCHATCNSNQCWQVCVKLLARSPVYCVLLCYSPMPAFFTASSIFLRMSLGMALMFTI